MAVNFPNSPTDGQLFSAGGVTYKYISASSRWDRLTPSTVNDYTDLVNKPTIPSDVSDLTDTTSLLGSGTASALGTLTKTFTQNEEAEITLSQTISPVPSVSVFREIPQGGITAKGNWDVSANGANYDFLDEKPISYSNTTLTPSATGDGTFTSSNPITTEVPGGIPNSLGTAGAFTSQLGPHTIHTGLFNNGFWWSNDGQYYYQIGQGNGAIVKVKCTTPWDLSTQTNQQTVGTSGTTHGITVSEDGLNIYYGTYDHKIRRKPLSTAHDLSTAGSETTITLTSLNANATYPWWLDISSDGTKLFFLTRIGGSATDTIATLNLSTPYTIDTGVTLGSVLTGFNGSGNGDTAFSFNNNGSRLFVSDNTANIYYWALSPAYTLPSSTTSDGSITTPVSGTKSMVFNQYLFYTSFHDDRSGALGVEHHKQNRWTLSTSIDATSTSNVFNASDVGKKVTGNSGSATITSTAGAYSSITAFADTSAISSWTLTGAQGKADGSGIELSGYSVQSDIVFPTGASGAGASLVYNNNVSPTTSALTNVRNVGFNNEGTIALALTTTYLQRFNLSTPFDLSTMTEDAGNNNSSQHGSDVGGFAIKPDGTKYWFGDWSQDLVKQFTMSTAWSPSTASYDGYYRFNFGGSWNSFSGGGSIPSTNNFNPMSFQFNSDGTKFLTIMWDNVPYHSIAEFTLSTPWDMSTMSYTSYANLDGTVDPETFVISPDGLKLMLHGYDSGAAGVEVYSLPSAFSVGSAGSSLTKTSGAMDLNSLTGITSSIQYGGMSISNDGKRMYVIYPSDSKFYELTGGTTSVHPYSTYSPTITGTGGQINTSAWIDIDSMVADETKNGGDVFYAVSTDNKTSWGVIKDGSGVRKIAKNNSGTWQYNNDAGTSTVAGYDLSNSSSLNKTLSYTSQENSGTAMAFNNDGTKLYFTGEQNGLIHEYVLSTAYDISTSSYNNVTFDPSLSSPTDIKWKPDGTKLYIMSYNSSDRGTIYTFNVSTPYDITTASSANETFRGNAQDNQLIKFAFKSDGTMLFKLGRQGVRVHAYNLSTAWDVSTASYASVELSIRGVVSEVGSTSTGFYANGLAFNPSGTKIFVTIYHTSTASNNKIYEIDLPTAWDIGIDNNGNGNYAGVYLQSDWAINVLFNGNGSQVYVFKNTTDTILTYSSGTTTTTYGTNETWVNSTTNNELAALQQALGAQTFNRMDKAQLQAVSDANQYTLGNTLDLMIAPYATSGISPISDGVTVGYQAEALIRQAINGTDYEAEFPTTNKVKIKSLAGQNLKIRII